MELRNNWQNMPFHKIGCFPLLSTIIRFLEQKQVTLSILTNLNILHFKFQLLESSN